MMLRPTIVAASPENLRKHAAICSQGDSASRLREFAADLDSTFSIRVRFLEKLRLLIKLTFRDVCRLSPFRIDKLFYPTKRVVLCNDSSV